MRKTVNTAAVSSDKNRRSRAQRLAKLFVSTLYISSFTFGGGFVIVTFMKKKFVDELHWLTEQEMLDMTAMAQASPVPLPSMPLFSWAGKLRGCSAWSLPFWERSCRRW